MRLTICRFLNTRAREHNRERDGKAKRKANKFAAKLIYYTLRNILCNKAWRKLQNHDNSNDQRYEHHRNHETNRKSYKNLRNVYTSLGSADGFDATSHMNHYPIHNVYTSGTHRESNLHNYGKG